MRTGFSSPGTTFAIALLCVATASVTASTNAAADERLKDIACRSVHLGYPAPEGDAFYCETTIDQTAPGTYFMVCGFNMGYFGIQELADNKKVILFSVWEPGEQNNPNTTPEERRVQTISSGDGVRVKRFGGEGTGGQSFYDYDWQVGQTYRFVVYAKPAEERTVYTGFVYIPDESRWQQMASFSTLANQRRLSGYYSFVEDFRRNRISTTHVRRAFFGNGWVRTLDGEWKFLDKARFTADANPVTNINAGLEGERFFLATGGETKNSDTELRSIISFEGEGSAEQPADLPQVEHPAAQ